MGSSLKERMAKDAVTPVINKLDVLRVKQKVSQLMGMKAEMLRLSVALEKAMSIARRIETEDLPSLFDEVGVQSMTIDGKKIEIKTEYYPHVKKEDEAKFFAWLRKNNFDSIIKNEVKIQFSKGEDNLAVQVMEALVKKYKKLHIDQKMTVHAGTLKAFVKEQVDKSTVLPTVLNINPIRTTIIK